MKPTVMLPIVGNGIYMPVYAPYSTKIHISKLRFFCQLLPIFLFLLVKSASAVIGSNRVEPTLIYIVQ